MKRSKRTTLVKWPVILMTKKPQGIFSVSKYSCLTLYLENWSIKWRQQDCKLGSSRPSLFHKNAKLQTVWNNFIWPLVISQWSRATKGTGSQEKNTFKTKFHGISICPWLTQISRMDQQSRIKNKNQDPTICGLQDSF